MSDCSNGAGYCTFYSYFLLCYISNNETQLINSLISNCSNQTNFDLIHVYKDYVSTTYGNLIIDIELPSNIEQLFMSNSRDQDHFRLTTSSKILA